MKRSSIIILLLCFIACVMLGKHVLAQVSGYLVLSGVMQTNPLTFINSSDGGITVKQGVPLSLSATYSADYSAYPARRCLWNMDFYQGSTTYESSLPAFGGGCIAHWESIVFNSPPGTYTYPLIAIATSDGTIIGVARIYVTIEPHPSPTPVFTATPTPSGFPSPSSSPSTTPTPSGFPSPSSSPSTSPTPTPSGFPTPSSSPNPGANGTIQDIRYVSFTLTIDADPSKDPPPVVIQSQVQLRNLKTNL